MRAAGNCERIVSGAPAPGVPGTLGGPASEGRTPRRAAHPHASYWLYLAHPPLVFGLQALLMRVPLHWAVKFPLIVAVTLAVLLASYRILVRPTVLGEILDGRTPCGCSAQSF